MTSCDENILVSCVFFYLIYLSYQFCDRSRGTSHPPVRGGFSDSTSSFDEIQHFSKNLSCFGKCCVYSRDFYSFDKFDF